MERRLTITEQKRQVKSDNFILGMTLGVLVGGFLVLAATHLSWMLS